MSSGLSYNISTRKCSDKLGFIQLTTLIQSFTLKITNLDEVVQVAKFAHIRDPLLFGHILEDLSHVLGGVWKKR